MSKIEYLPVDYEIPKAAGPYMKLQEGENRVRILSMPLIGWRDWNQETNKPVRYPWVKGEKPPKAMGKDPVVHFWALIVWDYVESRIRILEVTQKTVIGPLYDYLYDPDWGNFSHYDVKITKTKGAKTSYSVKTCKPEPLLNHIREMFYENRCNLSALMSNGEPFSEAGPYTKAAFEDELESEIESPKADLHDMLMKCPAEFQKNLADWCKRKGIDPELTKVPDSDYDTIYKALVKNLAVA